MRAEESARAFDQADVAFIGTVSAFVLSNGEVVENYDSSPDPAAPYPVKAVLVVEEAIRGVAEGEAVEVRYEAHIRCSLIYRLGERWLYAGGHFMGPDRVVDATFTADDVAEAIQTPARN